GDVAHAAEAAESRVDRSGVQSPQERAVERTVESARVNRQGVGESSGKGGQCRRYAASRRLRRLRVGGQQHLRGVGSRRPERTEGRIVERADFVTTSAGKTAGAEPRTVAGQNRAPAQPRIDTGAAPQTSRDAAGTVSASAPGFRSSGADSDTARAVAGVELLELARRGALRVQPLPLVHQRAVARNAGHRSSASGAPLLLL